MQDGYLARIYVTRHRIQSSKETVSIYLHPYRAGPWQRQLERRKMNKMLKANVTYAAKTEWAPPYISAPRRDGSMRFCIGYRK